MPHFWFNGAELHRRRIAAGLRPEHVAVGADVSVDSIRSYENGRVTPRAAVVARLAEALGCEPGDLFTEGDDPVERLIDQRAEQGLDVMPTDAEADDAVKLLGRAET